jgi:hypothetical protein
MTSRLSIFLVVLGLLWILIRNLPMHVAPKNIKPQQSQAVPNSH